MTLWFNIRSDILWVITKINRQRTDAQVNAQMLVDYLKQYNEEELFYINYYRARKDPEHLKRFLGRLDMDYVNKHKLIIPERLPEKIPRLMMDSRYFGRESSASVYLCKHNRYTPFFFHTHIFFEVIYVLEGRCTHILLNEKYELKTGDLCILSPSLSHGLEVNNDSIVINILIRRGTIEDIFFNTLRDQNIISDFMRNSIYLKDYATYVLFHTQHDEAVRQQFLDMYMEQFTEDEYSDRLVSSMLMVFFTKLVRKYKKTVYIPPYSEATLNRSSQIISYILEDCSNVTLAWLAKKLGYSIPYCSRYIKNITGFTFQQLLKNVRFQEAETLLTTTTMNIRAVSEKLGYENPESFIRLFKKEYGVSPHQFRQTHLR